MTHVDGGLRVEAVQVGAIEQARRDAGRLLRAAKQQGHVPCVAHPDALRRSARLHNTKQALRYRSKHSTRNTAHNPPIQYPRPRYWQSWERR